MKKQYTLYAIIGFSIMGLFSAYNLIQTLISSIKFGLSVTPLIWYIVNLGAYALILMFFIHLYKTQNSEE